MTNAYPPRVVQKLKIIAQTSQVITNAHVEKDMLEMTKNVLVGHIKRINLVNKHDESVCF